jgi:hypothetical protein
LPGTFVIFIYEFETAEKLHSTRRFYSYSASKAVSAAKGASSSNSSSKDEAAAAATAGNSSSSNSTAGTSLLFSGRNIVGELQGDQNIRLEDLLVSQVFAFIYFL